MFPGKCKENSVFTNSACSIIWKGRMYSSTTNHLALICSTFVTVFKAVSQKSFLFWRWKHFSVSPSCSSVCTLARIWKHRRKVRSDFRKRLKDQKLRDLMTRGVEQRCWTTELSMFVWWYFTMCHSGRSYSSYFFPMAFPILVPVPIWLP